MATAVLVVAAVAWGATSWLLGEANHAADVAGTRVEAIKTGLGIAAGTGGLFALLLAVRRQWHQEIAVASRTLDAAERRVTELYTKAVEQLGSDKAPVRLGGLYALERLAQHNLEQRQTMVNVVCAYLRMPYEPTGEHDIGDAARLAVQEREVRQAVQRILTNHLRPGSDPIRPSAFFWPDIDLNLTGALLIDFNLSTNCAVRTARFDRTRFSGNTSMRGIRFAGIARFRSAVFEQDVSFSAAVFGGDALFNGAQFGGRAGFRDAESTDDSEFTSAALTH